MGTQGAIQNPDIGQILKGMWGQQNHIVSTVCTDSHHTAIIELSGTVKERKLKYDAFVQTNTSSEKSKLLLQNVTNPQSHGEKDKALEGHLHKIFGQLHILYISTDQAKNLFTHPYFYT